jgi:hypothetical protein
MLSKHAKKTFTAKDAKDAKEDQEKRVRKLKSLIGERSTKVEWSEKACEQSPRS